MNEVASFISTVGFPIAIAIGLVYMSYQGIKKVVDCWHKKSEQERQDALDREMRDREERREVRLEYQIREDKLTERLDKSEMTLNQAVQTLDNINGRVTNLETSVYEIKEIITKK